MKTTHKGWLKDLMADSVRSGAYLVNPGAYIIAKSPRYFPPGGVSVLLSADTNFHLETTAFPSTDGGE